MQEMRMIEEEWATLPLDYIVISDEVGPATIVFANYHHGQFHALGLALSLNTGDLTLDFALKLGMQLNLPVLTRGAETSLSKEKATTIPVPQLVTIQE